MRLWDKGELSSSSMARGVGRGGRKLVGSVLRETFWAKLKSVAIADSVIVVVGRVDRGSVVSGALRSKTSVLVGRVVPAIAGAVGVVPVPGMPLPPASLPVGGTGSGRPTGGVGMGACKAVTGTLMTPWPNWPVTTLASVKTRGSV